MATQNPAAKEVAHGTCLVCNQQLPLMGDRIILHGSCPGSNHKPFEAFEVSFVRNILAEKQNRALEIRDEIQKCHEGKMISIDFYGLCTFREVVGLKYMGILGKIETIELAEGEDRIEKIVALSQEGLAIAEKMLAYIDSQIARFTAILAQIEPTEEQMRQAEAESLARMIEYY